MLLSKNLYNEVLKQELYLLDLFKNINFKDKYLIFYQIAVCLSNLKNHNKALVYALKAKNFCLKNEFFHVGIYNLLGHIYTDLNDLKNAEKFYLEGGEKTLNYPNILIEYKMNALSSLASFYRETNNFINIHICINRNIFANRKYMYLIIKIKDLYRKALSMVDKKEFKKNPDLVSMIYFNYCNFLADIGETDESIVYALESIKIRKKFFGIKNIILADNYNNLGTIYTDKFDFKNAKYYLEKSLEMKLKFIPNDINKINLTILNLKKLEILKLLIK